MLVTLAAADVMCFSYHEIKRSSEMDKTTSRGMGCIWEETKLFQKKGYKIPLFNEWILWIKIAGSVTDCACAVSMMFFIQVLRFSCIEIGYELCYVRGSLHKIVIYVIDTFNCITLYHKVWQLVLTNYMAILRPVVHIEPKLQLSSFILHQNEISVFCKMHIYKIWKLFKNSFKITC